MSAPTTLVGSLTHDPEIKFLNGGNCVVKFSIAVNRKRKDVETVSYFDCEAWGTLAENVANSLKKGDRVVCWGELKQDRFEVEGKKRSAVIMVADAVGAELRFATATPTRTASRGGGSSYQAPEEAF